MKALSRNLLAWVLAGCVLVGMAVPAMAADTAAASADYSISVRDSKLSFSRGGKTYSPYEMKKGEIRLSMDKDGDLLVSFTDTASKTRSVSLGQQESVSISGAFDTLTLTDTLAGKKKVTLSANCDVDQVNVASRGQFVIAGSVGMLNVTGAAKITATATALINTARLANETARLTAEQDATVLRVTALDENSVRGPGIDNGTTRVVSSSYDDDDFTVRLRADDEMVYYATKRDGVVQLRDLDSDDIADYVNAIGTDEDGDKHHLSGTYTWKNPKQVIFDADNPASDTFSCRYTFKPNDEDYPTTSGWIRIRVVYR